MTRPATSHGRPPWVGMRDSSSIAVVMVASPKAMVARARSLAVSQAPANEPAMAASLTGSSARPVAVGG
jgi:hypothetical protein